jgi:nitroimidazol reductase NimA-like FMN-containing flavoprotein (pyridoxamine 5'-phosphate oxidase superfamily)
LGVPTDSAPIVLPINYAVHDSELVIQIGERLFGKVSGRIVAFQVDYSFDGLARDGGSPEGRWSVLLRGLASEIDWSAAGRHFPKPRVAEPGHRLICVRGDVVTGRRLRPPGPDEGTSD